MNLQDLSIYYPRLLERTDTHTYYALYEGDGMADEYFATAVYDRKRGTYSINDKQLSSTKDIKVIKADLEAYAEYPLCHDNPSYRKGFREHCIIHWFLRDKGFEQENSGFKITPKQTLFVELDYDDSGDVNLSVIDGYKIAYTNVKAGASFKEIKDKLFSLVMPYKLSEMSYQMNTWFSSDINQDITMKDAENILNIKEIEWKEFVINQLETNLAKLKGDETYPTTIYNGSEPTMVSAIKTKKEHENR